MPGGDAGHTDCTQVMADGHMRRVYFAQSAGHVGVNHAIGLPATHADHFVAGRKSRVAAFNHFTDGTAYHHAVERLRQGLAFDVVHAPAHVRIEAEVFVFDQHLVVL